MSYTCGTGAWSGPLPGDPDTSNTLLTATPAFGGIDVSWTNAVTNPHAVAHTYLYRSTANSDFLSALRIATVGGTHFYDKLEELATYYYWIQVVSINGTVGPVIGPASAVPRLSINETIIALTGRIDNGMLAQSLKTDIDKITLTAQDLDQEILDRVADTEYLGSQLTLLDNGVNASFGLVLNEINTLADNHNALAQSYSYLASSGGGVSSAIEENNRAMIGYCLVGGVTSTENTPAECSAAGGTWVVAAPLAESVKTVQITDNDGNIASVQQLMQSYKDGLGDLGALYTAKVGVNGLIGGFGVFNDGTEVQAGFDVDTFWVGRTGPDKKKPFIIDSVTGETYIDKAVIPTLTANMIDTRGLSIKDTNGNIILAAGTALDWGRIGGVGKTTVETNASTALTKSNTAQITANNAATTAASAQTAANTANTALADIASDSKLTPAEKKITKKEWDGIVAEKAGINSQASSFSITTENTTYNNSYNTLSSYITPLLSSLTTTSDIVGSTFRSTFSTFYSARQALLNKISAEAAKKADWANVINKTGFASISQINTSNISTYIANAAIGNAQIGGDLWSTNWSGWGGNGWLLSRSGSMYLNNVYARGDIEASRLKAGAAMVETLHIKGEAVVVPRIASTQSGLYFGSGMSATVQSVYIDAGGANVTVVGKVTVSVPQSTYYQTIQSTLFLYAPNGQLLDSSSGVTTGAGGTLSLMVMGASPQAGTYYMTVSSAGSVTVLNRVLSATGAKR